MPAVQVRRERLNIEWSVSRQWAVSHHHCLYLRSYGEPLLFQAPSVSRLTESTRAGLQVQKPGSVSWSKGAPERAGASRELKESLGLVLAVRE